MFDHTAHSQIHQGNHFTIEHRGFTHFYRSYIYQRKTFVKFIQPNGNETHLGRYDEYGIHFNKKYQRVRPTARNRQIAALKDLSDYLQGKIDRPDRMVFSVLATDSREVEQTREMIQEAREDKDYFYRIGYA